MHVCVKLHNATQVLDDHMDNTHKTLPTLADAEGVGRFSEAVSALVWPGLYWDCSGMAGTAQMPDYS